MQSIATMQTKLDTLTTQRTVCPDPTVKRTYTLRIKAIAAQIDLAREAQIKAAAAKPARKAKPSAQTREDLPTYAQRLAHMSGKPATIGQMRRINSAYKVHGLRPFDDLDTFRACIGDMAAASLEWNKYATR